MTVTEPTRRPLPRLLPFLITGAGLGALAGLLVASFGGTSQYSANQELGSMAVVFGMLGLLLGAVAYLVADRRSRRGMGD